MVSIYRTDEPGFGSGPFASTCGHTKFQTIVEAKTLGLQQEFQSGIYTCCQIADWAAEHSLAWFEATRECRTSNEDATKLCELDEMQAQLVRVRTRRPQVPWSRNSGDLG